MVDIYAYGLIGRRISKYGFVCGQSDEKGEFYYLQTGKYTALIIEGSVESHVEFGEEMYYDFYKQSSHPRYSKCNVLGEHLDSVQLLNRLERYFKNREWFLKKKEQGIEMEKY